MKINRHITGCIALVSAVALIGGLAACSKDTQTSSSSSSGDGVVNLTLLHRFADKGSVTIESVVQQFNESHPNIQVKQEKMQGSANESYAKISSIIQGGTDVPCLVQIGSERLGDMAPLLQDVSQYAEKFKSQFQETAYKKGQIGNAVYGFATDQEPILLYYRKDLFDKYGLDVPTTWEEYKEDAKKVREESGNTAYLGVFETDEHLMLSALSASAGAQWYNYNADDESWDVNIDAADSQKVAAYWQDLIDNDLVMPTQRWGENFNKYLSDGTLVAHIGGPWESSLIMKAAPQGGQWAVAQIPQFDTDNPIVGENAGSLLVVTKTCEDPEAATEFAGWWATNIDAQVSLGSIPAAKVDSIETPENIRQFFSGEDVYAEFLKANSNVAHVTWAPKIADMFTQMDNYLGKVGTSTKVSDALVAAQKTSVDSLKSYGLTVNQG